MSGKFDSTKKGNFIPFPKLDQFLLETPHHPYRSAFLQGISLAIDNIEKLDTYYSQNDFLDLGRFKGHFHFTLISTVRIQPLPFLNSLAI